METFLDRVEPTRQAVLSLGREQVPVCTEARETVLCDMICSVVVEVFAPYLPTSQTWPLTAACITASCLSSIVLLQMSVGPGY